MIQCVSRKHLLIVKRRRPAGTGKPNVPSMPGSDDSRKLSAILKACLSNFRNHRD